MFHVLRQIVLSKFPECECACSNVKTVSPVAAESALRTLRGCGAGSCVSQEVCGVILISYVLTYLLTPWSRVLLEKLTSQLCS